MCKGITSYKHSKREKDFGLVLFVYLRPQRVKSTYITKNNTDLSISLVIQSFLNLTNDEQVEPNKATYKKFSFHSLAVCHEHSKMRQQKSLDTVIAIIYCYFENATIRLFFVI